MKNLTDTYDKIVTSFEEKLQAFETAKVSLNEACTEFVTSVDKAESDEIMDASLLKKRMKDKVMEVLTDDTI